MTRKPPAILLIGDTLNVGGTEGQFVETACGLHRARWDVRVACLRAEGPLRAKLDSRGIAAWSCGRGSFKSPRFASALVRLARSLRVQRIQLTHSFDFYSNTLGILAARLARVPVVIASQRRLGDLRSPFQERLHLRLLRLADRVLVNSEAAAERMRRLSPQVARRIALIPNGIDLDRFAPPAGLRVSREEVPVIGTLGNLRREKGIDDFLRAADLVRRRCAVARFVIWGDGPLREEWQRLAAELSLGDRLEFRGRTPSPESALRELDVFVLPSHSEACSNALLEAMATGLAVVATRVGGNVGLVEEGRSGVLVPPADPVAIAEAVVRLIEQPALAGVLRERARERVREGFGMDRMIAEVEALYRRALAEPRRRGRPTTDEAPAVASP